MEAAAANPREARVKPGPPPRLGLAGRAFLAVALAGVAAHAAGALFSESPLSASLADWLYGALFAATILSLALRAHRERRDGGDALPWAIATVGVTVWLSAEVSYRLLEPNPDMPYPPATQGLLLVGFGLATTTLVLLARKRIDGFHKGLAADGLIGGLAVAAIAASLLFPLTTDGVGIAQPGPPTFFLLTDIGVLAFVVVAIALTGWRPGACWGLMSAGIMVNLAGNVVLVQASSAGVFHRGSLADSLYVASALLLGMAAWYPIVPSVRRRADEARRVAAPLIFAGLALAFLCLAAFEPLSPVAVFFAATTLALTLLRTAFAFRDNRDLLDARERDSLTDGLTGLGNRRMLMRDLEAALEDAERGVSVSLLLFDLDGFKQYNDTFGHPAGDGLLTRLGGNLREVVSGHGGAYRMGGDEFCTIVRTGSLKAEAIIAGASQALSETGSGFDVRPSYGSVALGHEASSVSEALHLADQRMYSQKQGRDGSVTREARAVLLTILKEREPSLDDHQHEVASLAQRVGAAMGLAEEDIDVLTRAAELHDIGKMATPDAILHKPGPLSDQEWEIMRSHAVTGERILRSVPALGPVARIVRWTHERIDGSGYPDGLSGDEIPLAARIVAVCDAFNAMTSERAYDRVRTREEAIAELRRCAGAQFDPEVVEAFCAALDIAPTDPLREAGGAPIT